MANRTPVVAHRNLALVMCDNATSLAEVLAVVDLSDVPHRKFGDRAIALPAIYAAMIHDALRVAGSYPRVVGGEIPVASDESEE